MILLFLFVNLSGRETESASLLVHSPAACSRGLGAEGKSLWFPHPVSEAMGPGPAVAPHPQLLLGQPLEAALVARGMGSSVVAQGMGFLPPAPGTWIALLSPDIGAGH